MATPSVSVALCTHNGAAFVREQVESILGQTVPVTEVVLSDDASTDDTVAIVEAAVGAWPAPRPRLTVIRNSPALGVVANFEQAVLACTGDLIALSDQDDVWLPDKLERFVELFAAEPDLLLAHSDATLVTADRTPIPGSLLESLEATAVERRQLVDGRSFHALIRRNLVTGATVVFRRILLDSAAPFPRTWVHDEWLAIVAAALSRTVLIDDSLIEYRQHGGNQIGAGSIGMSDRLDRLREPREPRNRRLLDRARSLADRYPADAAVPADVARRVAAKLAHEERRSALPRMRIARLPGIARELVRGRYGAYGAGLQDVLRDAVQPARESTA